MKQVDSENKAFTPGGDNKGTVKVKLKENRAIAGKKPGDIVVVSPAYARELIHSGYAEKVVNDG
jgi:hypothetical protein